MSGGQDTHPDGFTENYFQEMLGHYQGGCHEGYWPLRKFVHLQLPLAQLRQHSFASKIEGTVDIPDFYPISLIHDDPQV
jgi:hypothetical protein